MILPGFKNKQVTCKMSMATLVGVSNEAILSNESFRCYWDGVAYSREMQVFEMTRTLLLVR